MKECQVPRLGQMEIVADRPHSGKVSPNCIAQPFSARAAGPLLLSVSLDYQDLF